MINLSWTIWEYEMAFCCDISLASLSLFMNVHHSYIETNLDKTETQCLTGQISVSLKSSLIPSHNQPLTKRWKYIISDYDKSEHYYSKSSSNPSGLQHTIISLEGNSCNLIWFSTNGNEKIWKMPRSVNCLREMAVITEWNSLAGWKTWRIIHHYISQPTTVTWCSPVYHVPWSQVEWILLEDSYTSIEMDRGHSAWPLTMKAEHN